MKTMIWRNQMQFTNALRQFRNQSNGLESDYSSTLYKLALIA